MQEPTITLSEGRARFEVLPVGRSEAQAEHDAITPMLDDPQLNITGVHYFTFNQLLDTWRWQYEKQHASVHRSRHQVVPNGYANPERTTA